MNLFKLKLKIEGKNIERFIKRLISNNINIYDIKYYKDNIVYIIVLNKDYKKINDIKTIYEISKVEDYGIVKIKKCLSLYRYIMFGIFFSILLILFLSNVIFNVEVIHNNESIRNLMLKELESYGISKYKLKKDYHQIQIIKNDILEKYKDKIEWIEIENSGCKYIVRIEERLIPEKKEEFQKQNIIAKKSGIIKKIIADTGVIVKDIDSYVSKGETIISGNIYLNDQVKDIISAQGKVYAEVWYEVSVTYPYIHNEIKYTGNYKKILVLSLLNKNIELGFNKFNDKIFTEKVLLSNNLLPIKLSYQDQQEIIKISTILTQEQAIEKALEEAKKKMQDKLNSDESIIDYKILKITTKDDCIVINVFFSVIENITDYQIIN